MQLKKQIMAAALALAFGGAAQASDVILFDTNSADGVLQVGSFDWTVDNALADEAVPLAVSPDTTAFTLYAQAALGNFIDPTGTPIANTGLNSEYEITFQAGFGEIGSSDTTQVGNTVFPTGAFTLDPTNPVNFFTVWYDDTPDADPLAGTGYNNGQVILSGQIIESNGTFVIISPTLTTLDQFNDNDHPGVGTVQAIGGNDITADVTFQDFNFFLSNVSALITDLNHNSSLKLPFDEQDPARQVVGITPEFGGPAGGFAAVNGGACVANGDATCDFLLQQDSNTSFQVSQVPEPSSLALLGLSLGIFGFGRFGRKR